ncbi:MAG: putative bifunctional diguanylate cyclase/phosphodiesterase [Clostridia bacterium]
MYDFLLLSVAIAMILSVFYYRSKTEKSAVFAKNAEASMKDEVMRKIIEESPYLICVKDWEGRIVHVNSRYAAELKLDAETLQSGQSQQIPTEAFRLTSLQEDQAIMIGEDEKVEYSFSCINREGQQRWMQVTKIPFRHAEKPLLLVMAMDITERMNHEEMIAHQLRTDALTGLPNRVHFYEKVTAAIAEEESSSRTFAVMVLDLDRFKVINDMLGHGLGDQLLRSVALRLTELPGSDFEIARLSGDSFAVLLPNRNQAQTAEWAESIIQQFVGPFTLAKHELYITPSMGISMYPQDGTDAETLIKHADTAMYLAKEQGKNTYQFYQADRSAAANRKFMLEGYLRKALSKNEFELYYQPKMNIRTGELIGMEALLRWNHPELGMVSPADFIPLAEETGLIVLIGEWVIQTACVQNKQWQDEGHAPLKVSVNLSARQFQHDLVQKVRKALSHSGLDPQWLELEITESILMQNEETIISILGELKETGVLISIDDFGTGYCSLSYLKHFPLDTLKIAQPFIRDLSNGTVDAAIATALITLGHSLGLNVIAEGVETHSQLRILQDQECDEIQGYLLSRPLPSHEFAHWVQAEADKGSVLVAQ